MAARMMEAPNTYAVPDAQALVDDVLLAALVLADAAGWAALAALARHLGAPTAARRAGRRQQVPHGHFGRALGRHLQVACAPTPSHARVAVHRVVVACPVWGSQ